MLRAGTSNRPPADRRSNDGMKSLSSPPIFVSHGSPTIALEPGEAGAFMGRLGAAIDAEFGRPKAIVALSAHSTARTHEHASFVLGAAQHEAIYDFGNFDPRLNLLRYDAPGAPVLAERVTALLEARGLAGHLLDQGGLDHGIWTALRYVYPNADVPVLPIAFADDETPAGLFALGAALAPLADEGVLVMGTGSITHNLRRLFAERRSGAVGKPEIPESAAFRTWMLARSSAGDWDALFDWRRSAPHAVDMHPTDEHLLPWFVTAGAGGRETPPLRLHASVRFGCLGMDAYAFGPNAPRLSDHLTADAATGSRSTATA